MPGMSEGNLVSMSHNTPEGDSPCVSFAEAGVSAEGNSAERPLALGFCNCITWALPFIIGLEIPKERPTYLTTLPA